MATHRERLAGFLVHRCIHVGPGWPRVFRRLIQGSQNCIFWKKSSLQDFFRTCGDQVQYSFGIMFTDAVLDYQLEHGEDRVLKQLVAEP